MYQAIISSIYVLTYKTRFSIIDLFEEIGNDIINYDNYMYDHLLCGDVNSHSNKFTDITIVDDNICNVLDLSSNTRKMLDIYR